MYQVFKTIEDGYETMRVHIRESVSFIRERWNSILENDMYQQEVRDCVRACQEFRSTVEAFDECFGINRAYFNGVSDDSLRSLIVDQVPLPRRARWLGDRREATIFGKTLGLKCALMNKSFLFLNKDGLHRDLNYGSDSPTLDYSSYDITPIFKSLSLK